MTTSYITTALPYVNGAPHLGHALELVQADVLARHRRRRGHAVRLQTGTDDNAIKNVLAARAAGASVREFVDANAARFEGLQVRLDLSVDDTIRTSSDPRHAPGVDRLWRACAANDDFYLRDYSGLYCTGCEQFLGPEDLTDGRCPEHGTEPVQVAEKNWFFRLSRYADRIREVIESGRVRIEPPARRAEVLAFIRAGLADFSVSRPAARSDGWGIPVPDDPDQVVYVWWDAVANYVTALGYGGDSHVASGDRLADDAYRRWWVDSDERVHVIGKGIVRFHAVYWLAALLSAGEPLPTTIVVHDYLTVDGAKIAKSTGTVVDPGDVARRYGVDALRWWFVREVPRQGDADFTTERLVARANTELSNGIGNLVNRTLTLAHRYAGGIVPSPPDAAGAPELTTALSALPNAVDAAVTAFDLRRATDAIVEVVDATNRYVNARRPWDLGRAATDGDRAARAELDRVLGVVVHACRVVAGELEPFVPGGAARLREQLGEGTTVRSPDPVFPRLV